MGIMTEYSTLKELVNNYPCKHVDDEVEAIQESLDQCDSLIKLEECLCKELNRIRDVMEIEKLRLDFNTQIK